MLCYVIMLCSRYIACLVPVHTGTGVQFTLTQLRFRQTMNNGKRAKISDICPTGRRGRHSVPTDAEKVVLRYSGIEQSGVQIAVATLSGNSLRQTVHIHCASVHQAAKLVAALLRVAGVTAGLSESNGSLPPGL